MTVSKSTERDLMTDGSLEKKEVEWRLFDSNGGILELTPSYPSNCRGINLFFSDFFVHHHTFQVWKEGSFSNYLPFRLNKIINEERRNELGFRFLDECMGDASRSMHLIQSLIAKSGREKLTKEIEKMKSGDSNKSMDNLCQLSGKYEPFVKFRKIVTDQCLYSIDGCYGEFSKLTTPILSVTYIHSIACAGL